MKWMINLLRGRVTVTVTGAYPERLINLCAAHAVSFWGLERLDAVSFRFTVAFRDWKRVKQLAEKAMCETGGVKLTGLPAEVMRLRRRYAFWAGMLLCLLSFWAAPRFVLVVDVTGNETVPDAVIRAELRRLGVKPGAYAPALDEKALANEALIGLEKLSFLAINLNGCRAEVTVREAEGSPELLAQDAPADIVSTAAGIVLDIRAVAGQPLVERGMTVVEGDVLIAGEMDLEERDASEQDLGTYTVHAVGTVTARTWRTLRSVLPMSADMKELTGEESRRWSLNFFGQRLNFYQNSGISYERYDRITKTAVLTLPGGVELPVSLTCETARAYTVRDGTLDRDAAIAHLEEGLRRELDEILQETDGECVRADYRAAQEDGLLTVTLLAECVEQIGKTVLLEGETGYTPGTPEEKAAVRQTAYE